MKKVKNVICEMLVILGKNINLHILLVFPQAKFLNWKKNETISSAIWNKKCKQKKELLTAPLKKQESSSTHHTHQYIEATEAV